MGTKQKRFKPVEGDEQATTDAFEDYMGSVYRAQRIFGIYKQSYPGIRVSAFDKPKSKEEIFWHKAKDAGFTENEIDALLSIQ